ncbi:biotin transporter BioY [Brevundimonas sp. NPDC092305]|uniref:biotin transporter BioY n=1 Tax=Brevundimonas sp. NPDC092305 TaxID=3363957 RepID=UPI00381E1F98
MARLWISIPLFALLTALCAQISVPMTPVPMTLQSFAVVLSGLVLGARGGAAAMGLYLLLGAVGLPVFSDGGSGVDALTGETAGYLVAFPLAAGLAGTLSRRPALSGFIGMSGLAIGAHLLILALGATWLATGIGVEEALAVGFAPFLIGAIAKSLAAAGAALALRPFLRPA